MPFPKAELTLVQGPRLLYALPHALEISCLRANRGSIFQPHLETRGLQSTEIKRYLRGRLSPHPTEFSVRGRVTREAIPKQSALPGFETLDKLPPLSTGWDAVHRAACTREGARRVPNTVAGVTGKSEITGMTTHFIVPLAQMRRGAPGGGVTYARS